MSSLTVSAVSINNNGATISASWSGYTKAISSNYFTIQLYVDGGLISQVGSLSSTSSSHVISTLTPGTVHTIEARLSCDQGVISDTGSFTTTGTAPLPLPSAPTLTSFSFGGTLRGDVSISKGANATTTHVVYSDGSSADPTGTASYMNAGSYATQYSVSAYSVNATGNSGWSNTLNATSGNPPAPILPGVPTINSVSSTGAKSASINYSVGANTSYIVIELSNYDYSWSSSFNSYSSPNAGTFPNYSTTYYVKAYGVSSDGHISGWSNYGSITTGVDPSIPVRPSNWSWTVAKVQGGNETITKISDTLFYAYIMNATEWNAFTARITAFLLHKQLSTTMYPFTTVSSGMNFTTAILNEAINNINRMSTSGAISYGNDITAQVFNDMRDALNSVI